MPKVGNSHSLVVRGQSGLRWGILIGGVVFVDAIPKTPSGKILKRVLREQAAKEMGAKL